jgi:hypothetical protein
MKMRARQVTRIGFKPGDQNLTDKFASRRRATVAMSEILYQKPSENILV